MTISLDKEWSSQREIAKAAGLSDYAAKKRLKRMQERGEVERRVHQGEIQWRKKS